MKEHSRYILFALLTLCVLLPGLASMTMERQQELRVGICARNMVESGDWIVPTFQDQPRLRKPPLLYWMSAASMKMSGSKSAFTARVPAVLAGVALVLLMLAAGRVWLSNQGGALAAVLLMTCIGFLRHGRLAETDMTLTLFTTATVLLLYRALQHRGYRYWIGAGLCMGLGIMAKGPAAVVIPLLAIGVYLLFAREERKNVRPAGWVIVVALAALLAIPWYAAIHRYVESAAGSQVGKELTALIKTEHRGNPAYYLYTLPAMFLPWGLLLPFAAVSMWKARKNDRRFLFLLVWLNTSLLLLTVTPSKQAHYAVLMLPPAALITAWWLRARSRRWIFGIALAVMLLNAVYAWFVYPRVNGLSRVPEFLTAARAITDEAPRVHVVGINSAVFDFYLGRHVHNIDDLGKAWKRAGKGDAVVVVQKSDRVRDFPHPPIQELLSGEFTMRLYKKE